VVFRNCICGIPQTICGRTQTICGIPQSICGRPQIVVNDRKPPCSVYAYLVVTSNFNEVLLDENVETIPYLPRCQIVESIAQLSYAMVSPELSVLLIYSVLPVLLTPIAKIGIDDSGYYADLLR
jgi:hypothetical protein